MWRNSKWDHPLQWDFAMDNQCNRPHGNPAHFLGLDGMFLKKIIIYSQAVFRI
jgi:hypothetical protein